jgi:hypothetical protein
MAESDSPEISGPRSANETARRARKLFGLGSISLTALLGYYAVNANVEDPVHLYQALAIIFLAVLPSLLWAKSGNPQLPVFEVLMLTTANTYALPLLNGHADLRSYAPEVITTAATTVLLFQVIAIGTYTVVRGEPRRTRFFTEEIVTRGIETYLSYALALSTLYTFVYVFKNELIPYEINSVLRAIFFGLSLVSTFVQARRWGQGTLAKGERALFLVLLVTQIVIHFSTLFLVGGISIAVLAVVAYIAGSHRLPIVSVAMLIGLLAVLHNGKSAMRDKFWSPETGQHEQVEFTQLPQFFSEWIQSGLTFRSSAEDSDIGKKLLQRTSLIHILCLVTSRTPDPLPFLNGETYANIPAQFVPRLFWPDKPLSHASTYTLSIYYGLQRIEDTAKTTIGFGMVPEAYANFGLFGVAGLGVLLGAAYKKVQIATRESPLLSYPGLFTVVLMAWSFQTEYTLSMWLSSMFQACVGVIGLPFFLRKFL